MILETAYFPSTCGDVGRFLKYLDKGYAIEDDLGREVDDELIGPGPVWSEQRVFTTETPKSATP